MKRSLINAAILISFLISVTIAGRPEVHAQPSFFEREQTEAPVILDVPYVPTPMEVVNTMLRIAGVNETDTLFDLGCGDGRIVVTAAKEMNVRRAKGFDIDSQRIRESNENARNAGVSNRVVFERKDLFAVDLREATVVSLYLLPSINMKLRPKLLKELKPGSRIVSHDFDMGDWLADQAAQLNEHTIYFWVVPAVVNGTWQWTSEDDQKQRYKLKLGQHFQKVRDAELTENEVSKSITEISLAGDKLMFTAEVDVKGLKGPVRFSGTVRENTIEGTVSSLQNRTTKKWSAQRDQATVVPVDESSSTVQFRENFQGELRSHNVSGIR